MGNIHSHKTFLKSNIVEVDNEINILKMLYVLEAWYKISDQ